MPWIASYINDSTEGKMLSTQNGPSLFTTGCFYTQYGTGITVASSTTDTSIIFNQATATANTLTVPTPAAAMTAVNLSSDPTGKQPGSTLLLPGPAQLNNPQQPYGALSLGTIFYGEFVGTVGITATPNIRIRVYLRNPLTGAIVYTICDTTVATFLPVAGSLIINPMFCVINTGAAGTIVGTILATGGTSSYAGVTQVTTVDTRQSYILDVGVLWSAISALDTLTVYYGNFEILS
jgi:hypothetical protein